MSGIITPILDTLLHEVLGKRVESQTHRELLEPVKPLSPGHAPRAVHSDSRLNAEQAAVQRQSSIGGGANSPSPTSESASLAPASTRTHFSAAARNIADILVKFPAPPSVVKPPAPLMVAGETVEPSQLASRLRQSIETSGLFYESHLARWHRGDVSRSQLAHEPQMQLFMQRHPGGPPGAPEQQQRILAIGERVVSAAGGQSGRAPLQMPVSLPPAPSSATTAQNPLSLTQPGEMQSVQGQTAYQPDDAALDAPRPAASSGDGRAEDLLHGIVRHQLELMVAPTLRWEGDLWSGVFMALAIHVPEAMERHGQGGKDKGSQEEEPDEAAWHSELTLKLPSLGTLGVNFYLRGTSLNMTLECDNDIISTLRAESHELEARFSRCGLADVKVSILPKRDVSETRDS